MDFDSKELKYSDNDLTSLDRVTIRDAQGNIKKVVYAKRIEDTFPLGIRSRQYGEEVCKGCQTNFVKGRKNQVHCDECISKRPMIGNSIRRMPLKSETLARGHANENIEIQKRI